MTSSYADRTPNHKKQSLKKTEIKLPQLIGTSSYEIFNRRMRVLHDSVGCDSLMSPRNHHYVNSTLVIAIELLCVSQPDHLRNKAHYCSVLRSEGLRFLNVPDTSIAMFQL